MDTLVDVTFAEEGVAHDRVMLTESPVSQDVRSHDVVGCRSALGHGC